MKRCFLAAALVATCAALAITANLWAPRLLAFVGANTDVIQGMSDLVQLALWFAAAIAAVLGMWSERKQVKRIHELHDSISATNGGVAAGQVAVKDMYGNIIFVADPNDVWRCNLGRTPPEELREATKKFLAFLVDRYQYLELKGIGLADQVPLMLRLISMYVPLKARIGLPEGDTWARHLKVAGRHLRAETSGTTTGRLSEPWPLLDLIRQSDGLVILGDPGAGKTTFLKYVALQLASGMGEQIGIGARLPILIPISAYATALAEGDIRLDRFVCEYYESRCPDTPMKQLLKDSLDQGRALILLDGLDEVRETSLRNVVVQNVMDFYASHRAAGNKLVLTSRIVGYPEVRPAVEGFAECTLVDFEEQEIEQFVRQWCRAVEKAARGDTPLSRSEAEKEETELREAIQRNAGIRRLASNPLLLTILALMKRQRVTLPERRAELYEHYLRTLISTWNRVRGLGRPPSRAMDIVETLRILAPLALWMHEASPGVGLVRRGDLERELNRAYRDRGDPDPERAAGLFISDLREHAGILVERGAGLYGFSHLTFEEYLAAVGIARLGQKDPAPIVERLAVHVGEPAWHEVALLTIGYLGIVQQWEVLASEVINRLLEQNPGEHGEVQILCGEAVVDAWPGGVTQACRTKVTDSLMETVQSREVETTLRVSSACTLARLGDPRRGVGVREDRLPDIVWCEIPTGAFLMGSDRDRDMKHVTDENPSQMCSIPSYYISRYPVTQQQMRAFVDGGGYATESYWAEAAREGIWKKEGVKGRFDDRARIGPEPVGEPWSLPNHPVVGLTWYEALAFCRWLNERWRAGRGDIAVWQDGRLISARLVAAEWRVVLPSEAQWEKAARGMDGREYPWGDVPDPDSANYAGTRIWSTSAVGCFPKGASPYGVEDMSGNVWEWTRTVYRKYPYAAADGREDISAPSEAERVVRGGSFSDVATFVRCAFRIPYKPDDHSDYLGFRITLCPV